MLLKTYLGDNKTLTIPLTWEDVDFTPGTDWGLIFTVKSSVLDADTRAKIQKISGIGIEHDESNAVVSLVYADSATLDPGRYEFDVQAQDNDSGEVRTVARGKIEFQRDVTRSTAVSVPINTTDPAPLFGEIPAWLAAFTSIAITEGDELELVQDGVTYWLPLYRRA